MTPALTLFVFVRCAALSQGPAPSPERSPVPRAFASFAPAPAGAAVAGAGGSRKKRMVCREDPETGEEIWEEQLVEEEPCEVRNAGHLPCPPAQQVATRLASLYHISARA